MRLLRSYLLTKADRITFGVAERMATPGTVLTEVEAARLSFARVLYAIAELGRRPTPSLPPHLPWADPHHDVMADFRAYYEEW